VGSGTLPTSEASDDVSTWTIRMDVPPDEAQYSVEVADRGKITESRAGWSPNDGLSASPEATGPEQR
jgi:hypothetical protein